jgi:hypothetical protein
MHMLHDMHMLQHPAWILFLGHFSGRPRGVPHVLQRQRPEFRNGGLSTQHASYKLARHQQNDPPRFKTSKSPLFAYQSLACAPPRYSFSYPRRFQLRQSAPSPMNERTKRSFLTLGRHPLTHSTVPSAAGPAVGAASGQSGCPAPAACPAAWNLPRLPSRQPGCLA